MRGLAAFLGGAFTVLAANLLAPAMGLDFAKHHPPDTTRDSMTQHVDRTHKGDRLDIRKNIIVRQPNSPAPMLRGCEPAFSPLASPTNNSISRCIT